jgi:hypothetical protein
MPDATKRPLSEWRDTEWLQHLQRQAQRLTACPDHANDLAHACLIAFYDHHRHYPGRGSAAVRRQRQHLAGVSARIAGEIRGFFRIRPIETGF